MQNYFVVFAVNWKFRRHQQRPTIQGKAMIARKNWTIEECLSKYIGQYQHEWTKSLLLAMMAYRSSIHSVTKYKPAYVVLGFPLSLPIDCIYSPT